jgi:hypothetical protein
MEKVTYIVPEDVESDLTMTRTCCNCRLAACLELSGPYPVYSRYNWGGKNNICRITKWSVGKNETCEAFEL